jgi:hypothetical protein
LTSLETSLDLRFKPFSSLYLYLYLFSIENENVGKTPFPLPTRAYIGPI